MTAPTVLLLLSDIDGTLVTKDKEITPRALAAVQALRRRTIKFTVVSSRPPRGLARFVEPLGLDLPLAAFNGGLITTPDLAPLESRPLGAALAGEAVDLFRAHGLSVWVYTAGLWIVPDAEGVRVARERFVLGFDPVARAPSAEDLAGAFKVVGVGEDGPKMATAEADAVRRFAGRASASRSEPQLIDVTHLEANKGFVVDWLSARLGIPRSAIATIGDMTNDISMFERSGFSVAMGNATPEVKARARAATADNQSDGFAKALEALLDGRLPTPETGAVK